MGWKRSLTYVYRSTAATSFVTSAAKRSLGTAVSHRIKYDMPPSRLLASQQRYQKRREQGRDIIESEDFYDSISDTDLLDAADLLRRSPTVPYAESRKSRQSRAPRSNNPQHAIPTSRIAQVLRREAPHTSVVNLQDRRPDEELDRSPAPEQLLNGRWRCNHSCSGDVVTESGKMCSHRCCREGLAKPPKAKRKRVPRRQTRGPLLPRSDKN